MTFRPDRFQYQARQFVIQLQSEINGERELDSLIKLEDSIFFLKPNREPGYTFDLARKVAPVLKRIFTKNRKLIIGEGGDSVLRFRGTTADKGGNFACITDSTTNIQYNEISINESNNRDPRDIVEIFVHELGHALEYDVYQKADQEAKRVTEDGEAIADVFVILLFYPEQITKLHSIDSQMVRDTIATCISVINAYALVDLQSILSQAASEQLRKDAAEKESVLAAGIIPQYAIDTYLFPHLVPGYTREKRKTLDGNMNALLREAKHADQEQNLKAKTR